MELKSSYFYVLFCKDESFYGGYTTDLVRREKEHNTGGGAKYTKPAIRRPVKMIYAEAFNTRSEATKAEYAFKKKTRRKKEEFLEKEGIQFPVDLSLKCIIKDTLLDVKEAK
ncbi:GIY-YIG nuclease family protein [Carnobacterium sp.]|uniref:GIY-YIG nuclease family protein n=1 Tax=Carnobacterium sp. TaxID=48221 RepID=UPI003C74D370